MMPGNLLHYSGLLTKTRAMSGRLLAWEELRQLTEVATVNEAILYLKGKRAYGAIYQGQESNWHRSQAEELIINSLYEDVIGLYRFADIRQRKSLEQIFLRYETDLLKVCLKLVCQGSWRGQSNYLDEFWGKHTQIPLAVLRKAESIQEFGQALMGTMYEPVVISMQSKEQLSFGDYAQQFDIHYFTNTYQKIQKWKPSIEKKVMLQIIGTQIDWLNIMWIYRSIRFYRQSPADIFAALIPVFYRLRQAEIVKMTQALDIQEQVRVLSQTAYFKGKEAFVEMEDEISYQKVMKLMYQRISKKYPVSMAPVLKYIWEKEHELERVTTILEGIRYQVPPKEIKDLVFITK